MCVLGHRRDDVTCGKEGQHGTESKGEWSAEVEHCKGLFNRLLDSVFGCPRTVMIEGQHHC